MSMIYLDHAATTPLHPEVLDAMLPFLKEQYGNPSSLHALGREARHAMNRARDEAAEYLGCKSNQLVFTSGGTESDNLAVIGSALANRGKKKHLITTQVEHHAVLYACTQLEQLGFEVTYIPVNRQGMVDVDQIKQAIRPDTFLISCMYVNNEIGTIQPIEAIGELARANEITFHVDAVQALGAVPLSLNALPVDLMSFSAHKINGPKGMGLLYAASNVKLLPMIHGGSQERKRRAGTENVAGAVGLSKAIKLAIDHLSARQAHIAKCRSVFLERLNEQLDGNVVINGHESQASPHILNVSFPGTASETLLMNLDLDGVAAASGSACTSGSLLPSHVLTAMGLAEDVLKSAIRFSFSYSNTIDEVLQAAKKTATIVLRLRNKY